MTRFPAGIEFFKKNGVGPASDAFSRARVVLHDKLSLISCPEAVIEIPKQDLFEQVGVVVDELLEFEGFNLSPTEQTVLSRVLAYDLLASQARKAMIGRLLH